MSRRTILYKSAPCVRLTSPLILVSSRWHVELNGKKYQVDRRGRPPGRRAACAAAQPLQLAHWLAGLAIAHRAGSESPTGHGTSSRLNTDRNAKVPLNGLLIVLD